MTFKKSLLLSVVALLLCCAAANSVAAKDGAWDAAGDVRRLQGQVPSLAAFAGVKNLVWLNSYKYALNSAGHMEKRHRLLIMSGESGVSGKPVTHVIPVFQGGSTAVTEASWYTPSTAKKEGSLSVEKMSSGGIEYLLITIPPAAQNKVIAIETLTLGDEQYSLEDVIVLDRAYPVWEGSVTVSVSDGMTLYWRVEELGEPERKKQGATEQFTWSIFNQREWRGSGIVQEKRPTLVFSLRKGLLQDLKTMDRMARTIMAPQLPSSLNLPKNNLQRAGEGIDNYMKSMKMQFNDLDSSVRKSIPEAGPWTAWERTLIAGRWLEKLGYRVNVFWKPVIEANDSFPGTPLLWQKPVLVVKDGEKIIAYESGQSVVFGKQPPSLYGAVLYAAGEATAERMTLQKGVASEHRLFMAWKLSLDPSGLAEGEMEASISGAWNDIFSLGDDNEQVVSGIKDRINFNVPGLDLKLKSIKRSGASCTVLFDVTASLGIASGSDILVRMPGAVPAMLEEIPVDDSAYSFNFPFSIEQSLVLTVPKGYSVITLKKGQQIGDSKASLTENIAFWPGKRQLESDILWTVKANVIDKKLNSNIREQFMQYLYWSQKTVPFRKK